MFSRLSQGREQRTLVLNGRSIIVLVTSSWAFSGRKSGQTVRLHLRVNSLNNAFSAVRERNALGERGDRDRNRLFDEDGDLPSAGCQVELTPTGGSPLRLIHPL
jgi:hypothetical protein